MADISELKARLENGIKAVFSSENWVNYLKFSASFHKYSTNNRILIFLQRPDATQVASFATWKKLGRHVKKDEKGIQILVPIPHKRKVEDEDGNELEVNYLSYKPGYVFDQSQTEGEPLPALCSELQGNVDDYDSLLEAVLSLSPVPVTFEEISTGAKGYYHTAEKRIVVKKGMSQMHTLKTCFHEISHATLHCETDGKLSKITPEQRETEAESVAYMAMQMLGFDSSDYSFEYLASWAGSAELDELHKSIDLITETAEGFVSKIRNRLDMPADTEAMSDDVAS